jgi:hypothetical protein
MQDDKATSAAATQTVALLVVLAPALALLAG